MRVLDIVGLPVPINVFVGINDCSPAEARWRHNVVPNTTQCS